MAVKKKAKSRRADDPIPEQNLQRAARVLRVLAHPDRMRLVEILMNGPVPVGDLADSIGLAPSAVSQHLNHMAAHGILEGERVDRRVLYRVISPQAEFLIDCLRMHGDQF